MSAEATHARVSNALGRRDRAVRSRRVERGKDPKLSRPLDPQVAAYLEQVRALGQEPIWKLEPEVSRRQFDEGTEALFGPPDPVASVDDVSADGVPVRIYRPAGAEGDGPALVYFHGGGWVIGSLASHDPLCRTLAARAGCTVVAVDYRLAPEHPFPAAIEDAWIATRWAAHRFSPLAVGGDSAGGQLAASVALRARAAGLPLALQVLIYPVTEHSFATASYRENRDPAALDEEAMHFFWSQYLGGSRGGAEEDHSPLRATDLRGLAPALVMTASHDPLRDEGEAYAARLREAGVPVSERRYEGMMHGFIRMPAVIDRAAEAIDEVAAAVRAALTGAPDRS